MMSGSNILQVMHNGEPLPSYEAAYAFLVSFTRHMIGQIVEVIYWKSPVEDPTGNDPAGALVAIGIKNWNECGPDGEENANRYLNKKYPIAEYPYGPCGEEFFDILGSGSGGGGSTGYNTTFNLNGVNVDVANNNERNDEVSDPFEWDYLNGGAGHQIADYQ